MREKNIDEFLHKKLQNHEHMSPILPGNIKNFLIDIDGRTICEDLPNEEAWRMEKAKIFPDVLEV